MFVSVLKKLSGYMMVKEKDAVCTNGTIYKKLDQYVSCREHLQQLRICTS